MRALEVVAEDLVVLAGPLAGRALHPVRVARVEIRATRLEHALVGDVANQAWVKLKVGLARGASAVGPISCLRTSACELRVEHLGVALVDQLEHGAAAERAVDHRAGSITARSPGSRRSRRAASSAWMVGGSESGDERTAERPESSRSS